MNDVVVVWIFYPFYLEKADELWVSHYYEWLNCSSQLSIDWYITYLQDLSDHYHDNIPINQSNFVQLLIEIIKQYLSKSLDKKSLWNNPEETYKQIIYEKLYLSAEDINQSETN
jgi:hypothetical protein